MVPRLQKNRDVHADYASHDDRDGENGRGNVDSETGMVEERVKNDTHALTAINNAEAIEGHNEE